MEKKINLIEAVEMIAKAKQVLYNTLVQIVAEYGEFKLNRPTRVKDYGGVIMESFYAESVSENDGEIVIDGHRENNYLSGVTDEETLTLDELTLDEMTELTLVVARQYDQDPYNNPMTFVGISDWADHYREEYAERKERLENTYKLKVA